jgi:hypothetical protein
MIVSVVRSVGVTLAARRGQSVCPARVAQFPR